MTVFHKIVAGELPAYKIAEDDNHLAFLDIYPTHYGQTVVIPKEYATSKFSEVPVGTLESTIVFAQKVAKTLETKLDNILRCEVVIAGFEIDYFHVKLLPIKDLGEVAHQGGTRAEEAQLQQVQSKLLG